MRKLYGKNEPSEKTVSWQHFQHDADIGIRGYGCSLQEAFTEAARAMMAVITEPHLIKAETCFDMECKAADIEYLFVDWLNALVYEMAVRQMLFSQFDVQINHGHLKATVCGEAIDTAKHQPAVEIKGVTLTGLRVQQDNKGNWLAQTVVDV
ncbi:MAG: archease [Gammaproteobacteria bacterium]|nr:archease [Gammaproteobacteria bacterium]